MASVPIYAGSSSFFPGDTPFGFYDYDYQFQSDADKVVDFCVTRLGYPIEDVELQAKQIYTCFEEAVTEYSNQLNQFAIRDNLLMLQGSPTSSNLTGRPINPTLSRIISIAKNYGTEAGSGGYITWKSASLAVTQSKQVYAMTDFTFEDPNDIAKTIELKKVFHTNPPAITRYFDPFVGTGLGSQTMLEGFGWGGYSPGVSFMMMPMYADLLRLQAIEFNDLIRRSGYSFEVSGDKLRLFPVPENNFKVFVQYITVEERNASVLQNNTAGTVGDFSNVPYHRHEYKFINPTGRQWILRYTLALSKEILGNIRNKYSSIPIPGSEITLNGADLVAQGQQEKDALITEIRENLTDMSRQTQLEKQVAEDEALQTRLGKMPLSVYIGALIPFVLSLICLL